MKTSASDALPHLFWEYFRASPKLTKLVLKYRDAQTAYPEKGPAAFSDSLSKKLNRFDFLFGHIISRLADAPEFPDKASDEVKHDWYFPSEPLMVIETQHQGQEPIQWDPMPPSWYFQAKMYSTMTLCIDWRVPETKILKHFKDWLSMLRPKELKPGVFLPWQQRKLNFRPATALKWLETYKARQEVESWKEYFKKKNLPLDDSRLRVAKRDFKNAQAIIKWLERGGRGLPRLQQRVGGG